MRFLHTFNVNPESEDEVAAALASSFGGKMPAMSGKDSGSMDPLGIGWGLPHGSGGTVSPAFFPRKVSALKEHSLGL